MGARVLASRTPPDRIPHMMPALPSLLLLVLTPGLTQDSLTRELLVEKTRELVRHRGP